MNSLKETEKGKHFTDYSVLKEVLENQQMRWFQNGEITQRKNEDKKLNKKLNIIWIKKKFAESGSTKNSRPKDKQKIF